MESRSTSWAQSPLRTSNGTEHQIPHQNSRGGNETCQKMMMLHFFLISIKSTLTSSNHHLACCCRCQGRGQAIICSAKKVIGCNLPSLQEPYAYGTLRHAGKIVADPSHWAQKLFKTHPSGSISSPSGPKPPGKRITSPPLLLVSSTRAETPRELDSHMRLQINLHIHVNQILSSIVSLI